MSDYRLNGPYGPDHRARRHRERRFLEIAVASAVIACVAAAVLIVAVRFRPPVFTVCYPSIEFTACVTAPTLPALTWKPSPVPGITATLLCDATGTDDRAKVAVRALEEDAGWIAGTGRGECYP